MTNLNLCHLIIYDICQGGYSMLHLILRGIGEGQAEMSAVAAVIQIPVFRSTPACSAALKSRRSERAPFRESQM